MDPSFTQSSARRANERNGFAFVAAIDAEVAIHGDDGMPGKQLAHAHQAEIREVRMPIGVAVRKRNQLEKVIIAVEREGDQPVLDHRKHDANVIEMEGGFRKNGFARQERFRQTLCDADCPVVVHVASSGECDQKAGIREAVHFLEKPWRDETSDGPPRMMPARRINFGRSLRRARSSWSRMILPRGRPLIADFSESHSAKSLVRRTVIV